MQNLLLSLLLDLGIWHLLRVSQNQNASRAAMTCRGCRFAAGQGLKTLLGTCCVNVYLFVHASEHVCVNAAVFFFVLSCQWLILTCRILTECLVIPGDTRPQGRSSLHFLLLSLRPPNRCPLSFHTSSPFHSNPFYSPLFLPTSLGLLICNIDIYCWTKWATVLQVVGGDSDVGQ